VLVLLLIVIVVIAIAVAIALKLRANSTPDLSGNWVAHQGVTTVNLTLNGSGDNLTGSLQTVNTPTPIQGTVALHVTGSTAIAQVTALGQTLTAHCTVSSSQITCTGTGGNQTLTLAFTRP
jgi:hypothetical protein